MEYLKQNNFYIFRLSYLYLRKAFTVLMFFLLCVENLYAQEFSREEVIAAYIFNFAKNIQWQNEDSISQFHFKIITGNKILIDEIEKLSLQKKIRNKPVKIIHEKNLTSTDNVHLVFITKDKEELIPFSYDKVDGKNILLISDNYSNKRIVMINLYETKDQTLEFEINKANIINQGLTILPEMVLLGGTEIDVAALYRESQVSLKTLQNQLDSLQKHEQELKQQIINSKFEIALQDSLINSQYVSINSQKILLESQKNTLSELFNEVSYKQDTLIQQSKMLLQRENELNRLKEEIIRGETILNKQQIILDSLNTNIDRQEKFLEARDVTISTQKKVLYLLILIVVLASGLSFSIYRGYKINKSINARLTKEIDDRTKVEEALGKSEDLYNKAPCGYHSLDMNGIIIRVNDTELEWLGYEREEMVGEKFIEFITENSQKIFEENFPKFKEQGMLKGLEFEMVCKNGSVLPVQLNATAITDEDGNFVMSRSTIFDITERKIAEEKIKNMNIELEKRVLERTSQLKTANAELESFAYSVSHDLRTPLRGIDGFSQMILEEYENKIDRQGQDYLNRIRSSTQRMAQLIDDILHLSRVSRTEMDFKKVDVTKMCGEIADNLYKLHPERNVEFNVHENIIITGDEKLLRIALENLISNAWKFTSHHHTAKIEFGLKKESGRDVYFIRDDGAGFDMNYRQKLFGVFERLHSEEEFPGTGIGLASVFRVIRRHGGALWAEGEIEKGATFYFTLQNNNNSD